MDLDELGHLFARTSSETAFRGNSKLIRVTLGGREAPFISGYTAGDV